MGWSDDSVNWFLEQAGRHPLLTAEEELTLSRRIQAWIAIRDDADNMSSPEQRRIVKAGRRAYQRFFNANLRLVVSVSKKYISRVTFMSHADLIQEGCLGLMRGIELFDSSRGYKFSTYGYWWIRQSMTRAIDQQNALIRLPIHANACLGKLRQFQTRFFAEHGRTPTPKECAEHVGLTLDRLRDFLAVDNVFSLDMKLRRSEEDGYTFGDIVADNGDMLAELEISEALDRLIPLVHTLPDPLRTTLERRYLNGTGNVTPYGTIGEEDGVSRERIRQRETLAIRALREQLKVQA